jgi:ankyrin repeat protein
LIQASSITTDDVTYVAWLLDNGAALDHKMRSGWTAAHAAAYIGNIKVLSLLLNRGADINSVATKKDVPPFRNLKPRDVAKNDETRNLLDR